MSQLELLNRIANRPEILAQVAPGHLHLDMAPFFSNPANLMLGNEHGVVLFVSLGEGLFAVHILFTETLRGRNALTALRMAFTALFTLRDAVAIVGRIPTENRACCVMARALGGKPLGSSTDAHGRSCNSYIMERASWVASLEALSAA